MLSLTSSVCFSEDQEESVQTSTWGGSRGLFNSCWWKALTFRGVFSMYLEKTRNQLSASALCVCVCVCVCVSSTSLADPGPLSWREFSRSSNRGTPPPPLCSGGPGSAGTTAVSPEAPVTTKHNFVLVQQVSSIWLHGCISALWQLWVKFCSTFLWCSLRKLATAFRFSLYSCRHLAMILSKSVGLKASGKSRLIKWGTR